MGRKHQFLTFFHRFLEIFYNFLHHTIQWWVSNGLRYMLSDLSQKGIIWPFVRYKTFILGKNINFWKHLENFWQFFTDLIYLEIFIISYTILFNGELVMTWDRYYLIYHKLGIIWIFVRYKTFILGRKHHFLTFVHRFLEIFYISLKHTIRKWIRYDLTYM